MTGILAGAKPVCMIHTSDAGRATAYYRDVLGLTLVTDDGFASVFETAGITIRVTPVGTWQPHPHTQLGFEVADLDTAIDALSAKGVVFKVYDGFGQDARGVWTAPGGSARVAWFDDPDGNNLSLTQF